MKFFPPTIALLLTLASHALARLAHRSVDMPFVDGQSEIIDLTKRASENFYKPDQSWAGKATSYLQSTDGHDGGACGYTIGSGPSLPAFVQGAAQQMGHFGGGNSCGTCLQIDPTNVKVVNPSAPRIVTILNSCPEPCTSLDIEDEVVRRWFGTRLGEFQMHATVVPCGYLSKGIHIEYRQIETTARNMWDFRINFRMNSGAIQSVEVSAISGNWLSLERANPDQYTLKDTHQSNRILTQPFFTLRFSNYVGEVIVTQPLPNTILRGGANSWQQTGVNFSKT